MCNGRVRIHRVQAHVRACSTPVVGVALASLWTAVASIPFAHRSVVDANIITPSITKPTRVLHIASRWRRRKNWDRCWFHRVHGRLGFTSRHRGRRGHGSGTVNQERDHVGALRGQVACIGPVWQPDEPIHAPTGAPLVSEDPVGRTRGSVDSDSLHAMVYAGRAGTGRHDTSVVRVELGGVQTDGQRTNAQHIGRHVCLDGGCIGGLTHHIITLHTYSLLIGIELA